MGNTPYGKRHTSRTKPAKPVGHRFEESFPFVAIVLLLLPDHFDALFNQKRLRDERYKTTLRGLLVNLQNLQALVPPVSTSSRATGVA